MPQVAVVAQPDELSRADQVPFLQAHPQRPDHRSDRECQQGDQTRRQEHDDHERLAPPPLRRSRRPTSCRRLPARRQWSLEAGVETTADHLDRRVLVQRRGERRPQHEGGGAERPRRVVPFVDEHGDAITSRREQRRRRTAQRRRPPCRASHGCPHRRRRQPAGRARPPPPPTRRRERRLPRRTDRAPGDFRRRPWRRVDQGLPRRRRCVACGAESSNAGSAITVSRQPRLPHAHMRSPPAAT